MAISSYFWIFLVVRCWAFRCLQQFEPRAAWNWSGTPRAHPSTSEHIRAHPWRGVGIAGAVRGTALQHRGLKGSNLYSPAVVLEVQFVKFAQGCFLRFEVRVELSPQSCTLFAVPLKWVLGDGWLAGELLVVTPLHNGSLWGIGQGCLPLPGTKVSIILGVYKKCHLVQIVTSGIQPQVWSVTLFAIEEVHK
eukprot:s3105_g9.t1